MEDFSKSLFFQIQSDFLNSEKGQIAEQVHYFCKRLLAKSIILLQGELEAMYYFKEKTHTKSLKTYLKI